jgi:GTP-binding protein
MQINSAEYYRSVLLSTDLPEYPLPQFAFIGRSNVGKSSFINCIASQKDLARSGSTPGVTKKVNLFLVNRKFYFADLPGYGYAKLSLQERKKLEQLIFWYLAEPKNDFRKIFLLVDSRHGLTPNDADVVEFLHGHGLPTVIIASKVDKLKNKDRATQLRNLKNSLPEGFTIIPFSAETNEGKQAVLEQISL